MNYKIMTPGPTQVRENVRLARSLECTNPDIDESFVEYYHETCLLISELLHTKNETIIMDGEGILGLEAACASLIEPGDRVLVLDNGIYGKGFADFVTMYGGEAVLYSTSYEEEIDPEALRAYLKDNHDFKLATLVHCDTPSGMLNPAEELGIILNEFGILTILDSVSAMFGEPLNIDKGRFDIVCGGSQKAVSAPPGLSFVTLSDKAKEAIKNRKHPIASFYANIAVFFNYYEEKWFPYTMPISDIYGLRVALDNIKADPDIYDRHAKLAAYTREQLQGKGIRLYAKNGYSNTVTAFLAPEGFTSQEILLKLREDFSIMIAGSFDVFAGQLLRIGHMGENANEADVKETLDALFQVIGR